ncbi:MAG: patatin-like phospholipase family protein [Fimbriimonadaceae bacterium]|nr:patatin-like phospholipase family protein [Fimbriimonadaceae bacterium]
MGRFRILSLDGGGLRGLLTGRLLAQLSDDPELAGWLDQVDLIAGTSTGGILALGLAAGQTPTQLADTYHREGPRIFRRHWLHNVDHLSSMATAAFGNAELERVVRSVVGDLKLGDLKPRVTVPAFDLRYDPTDGKHPAAWKPKIFHNCGGDDDAAELAWRVALRASAAPTYLPSFDGYIDGGVFANNPTMVAIAQALDGRNDPSCRPKLDDLVVLSVGTGRVPAAVGGAAHNWGYLRWAPHLLGIMMDGVSDIAHFQAERLLSDRYHRLQLKLEQPIDLADARRIPQLEDLASSQEASDLLDKTQAFLRQQWLV